MHVDLSRRLQAIGAILVLALPLSLGWHPTPTLGSLADAIAVFSVSAVMLFIPAPKLLDARRFWFGIGGLLGLFILRCLIQALSGSSVYAAFWIGPLAVLATAFGICFYWNEKSNNWLKVVAFAVFLAALINAAVGVLQYWRVASVIDFLGPYIVYWDRTDPVAHGNIAQRNNLASLCMLGIAASLYLFPKRTVRVVTLEFALAYVVTLTASRTPLLILLVVLILAMIRSRSWRVFDRPMVQWFVVPLLFAQVLTPGFNYVLQMVIDLPPMESAVERLSAQGLGIRVIYYQLAAEIGLQVGPLGLGWKSFPIAMIEHGYREGLWGSEDLPTNAHNLLLHLWVENGLVLAIFASIYPIWLLLRRGVPGPQGDLARLAVTVLVVHSWLEFPLWQPSFLFLFVLMLRVLELVAPAEQRAPAVLRLSAKTTFAAMAIGAAITAFQFVLVATSWKNLTGGHPRTAQAQIDNLRLNPVIEPYRDWLVLNLNRDVPLQRVSRLERLAQWLPDTHVLGLLSHAYREVGRHEDAERIDDQLTIVFGINPTLKR
jgi:hypothetical protein